MYFFPPKNCAVVNANASTFITIVTNASTFLIIVLDNLFDGRTLPVFDFFVTSYAPRNLARKVVSPEVALTRQKNLQNVITRRLNKDFTFINLDIKFQYIRLA